MSVTPPRPGLSADGPVLSISCPDRNTRLTLLKNITKFTHTHFTNSGRSRQLVVKQVSWQTNAWRTRSLSHDSSSGAGMALAGSRTRQKQRIPGKFDGISGTTCRNLAQYIMHKAHSPRNLRRLFPGTLTGCHSGDGRHWVRLHWLSAGGQLGRSRLMTSRGRVLATTKPLGTWNRLRFAS